MWDWYFISCDTVAAVLARVGSTKKIFFEGLPAVLTDGDNSFLASHWYLYVRLLQTVG